MNKTIEEIINNKFKTCWVDKRANIAHIHKDRVEELKGETNSELLKIVSKGTDIRFLHGVDTENYLEQVKTMIEELSNLVQKEREEALGEFVEMVKIDPDSCFYRFNVPEQMVISTYINEIFEKVGEYLSQTKGEQ